jgi:hypothetical protein
VLFEDQPEFLGPFEGFDLGGEGLAEAVVGNLQDQVFDFRRKRCGMLEELISVFEDLFSWGWAAGGRQGGAGGRLTEQ